MQSGQRVRIVHLEQRAELNNFVGVVTEFDSNRGRYYVKLSNGAILALKETNLEVIKSVPDFGLLAFVVLAGWLTEQLEVAAAVATFGLVLWLMFPDKVSSVSFIQEGYAQYSSFSQGIGRKATAICGVVLTGEFVICASVLGAILYYYYVYSNHMFFSYNGFDLSIPSIFTLMFVYRIIRKIDLQNNGLAGLQNLNAFDLLYLYNTFERTLKGNRGAGHRMPLGGYGSRRGPRSFY